jgi:hypothetical protein
MHLFNLWRTPRQVYEEFVEHYDGIIPEWSTIRAWFTQISRDGTLFSGAVKVGRPRDPDLAVDILTVLDDHPCASTKQIAFILGKAQATVKSRLLFDLKYKKFHFRWVPHKLDASQKKKRVEMSRSLLAILEKAALTDFNFICTGDESWIALDNPPREQWLPRDSTPPTFPKATVAGPKVLLTVFFSGARVLLTCYTEQGETMKTTTFIEDVLVPLRGELDTEKRFRGKMVDLHCDNASCHRSAETRQWFKKLKFRETVHPPYSPDISPPDFFLFGYLKEHLRGYSFRNLDDLMDTVDDFLYGLSSDLLQRVFMNWVRRLDMVIRSGGEYLPKHLD